MRHASKSMNSPGTAVVSGGSSGIGRAFVEELHRRGYLVLFCGRDQNKLRTVEAQCPGTRGFVCDVTDKASVLKFAREMLDQHDAQHDARTSAASRVMKDADRDLKGDPK